ncbi:hypothetical protein COU61_03270 [Candidatus Pacearchaeota archaeon CG10_big_fil_rev_8_21_14_0_10_35_13]|nr:MAG: hypothetical protein COU61_03270 [Candidatus Pacearchaeota archaeon CG10_big_fil_rev_8_21_14_0_10_35_13]
MPYKKRADYLVTGIPEPVDDSLQRVIFGNGFIPSPVQSLIGGIDNYHCDGGVNVTILSSGENPRPYMLMLEAPNSGSLEVAVDTLRSWGLVLEKPEPWKGFSF